MNRLGFRWYVLALVAATAAAALYVTRRDVAGRYQEYQGRQREVELVHQQVGRAGLQLEQTKRRVENLDADPVEMESAIRRIKGLVRPGETVYRIEEEAQKDGAPVSVKSD